MYGGLRQRFPRIGPLGRQARVAAGHQPLTGIVRMAQDLEQADLVGSVQLAGALQLADRAATWRRDPVDALHLAQIADAGPHHHAAVDRQLALAARSRPLPGPREEIQFERAGP